MNFLSAFMVDADIRILNEPLEGSSAFLVETGERQSLPETRVLCFSLA